MACEKCWGDAYKRSLADPSKSQSDHYRELLAERVCTPEEEAGVKICPYCKVRPVDAWGQSCTECDDMLANCDPGGDV